MAEPAGSEASSSAARAKNSRLYSTTGGQGAPSERSGVHPEGKLAASARTTARSLSLVSCLKNSWPYRRGCDFLTEVSGQGGGHGLGSCGADRVERRGAERTAGAGTAAEDRAGGCDAGGDRAAGADGMTNLVIAERLGITRVTVA